MLEYDWKLSTLMHPWRTLDNVFRERRANCSATSCSNKVCGRVVQNYLKIEHYFVDPPTSLPEDGVETAEIDEALAYVVWAKGSKDSNVSTGPEANPPYMQDQSLPGAIAQLRRGHFFKFPHVVA